MNGAPYEVGHSQAITSSSDDPVNFPWRAAQSKAANEDGEPSTPTTIRPVSLVAPVISDSSDVIRHLKSGTLPGLALAQSGTAPRRSLLPTVAAAPAT
jgi:hypothetical protein